MLKLINFPDFPQKGAKECLEILDFLFKMGKLSTTVTYSITRNVSSLENTPGGVTHSLTEG